MDPMQQAMMQMMQSQGGGMPPGGQPQGGPPQGPPMPPQPPPPVDVPMGQQVPAEVIVSGMSQARDILNQVVQMSDPAGEVADGLSGIVRELDVLIARASGAQSPVGPTRQPYGQPPPAGVPMRNVDESGAFESPTGAYPFTSQ